MANGILGFEGSIPDFIRNAARNALDMRRIEQNKLPLSVEGSGIPESVRKAAQKALENRPAPKLPLALEGSELPERVRSAAQATLEGEGRFGRVVNPAEAAPKGAVSTAAKGMAKFLGPVGGILAAREGLETIEEGFGPSRYRDISAAVENKQAKDEYTPEDYGQAQQTVSRGIQGVLGGIQEGADQYAEEAAQGKRPVSLLSDKKVPVEKAVDAAVPPGTPAPAKKAVAQQVEAQRQVVEQGAKKQLQSGELSRMDAAWAIAEADIRRSGEKLTPAQTQQRVAEEVSAMKKMDNDELSRYLSYALVAGGLIASAVDKSGAAGEAFGRSFNTQLDREQQKALFRYKQEQAAQAAAAEERRFQTQEARLNRGQDINAANVESQIADRERGALLDERKLNAQMQKWNQDAARADAKLAAYRERTAKTGGSGGKPPELSAKDATELVKSGVQAKFGAEVDDKSLPAITDSFRRNRQDFPELTTQELMDLTLEEYEGVAGEEGFVIDTPPSFRIKPQ